MAPLFVLLGAFVVCLLALKLLKKDIKFGLAGRLAMAVMLIFTAIGHFAFTKGMALMLPDFIPYKYEVVYLTGFIEIAGAVGLLLPRFQKLTAWLLILFFILILPANIHAAIHQIDYKTGAATGNGVSYLWFRVPLQLLFIWWVYFFAISPKSATGSHTTNSAN